MTVKRMNKKLINPNYGLKNKHILYSNPKGNKTMTVKQVNTMHKIASRTGKHRKIDVKLVKKQKVIKKPRTISKSLQEYNQILRTVRELYPYGYRHAQKLASEMYRSGIDSKSEIAIMSMESELTKRRDSKELDKVNEIINVWEREARANEDYEVRKVHETFNQKFRTWFDEYKVVLGKTAIDIDPIKAFMRILNKVKQDRDLITGDKIRLIISHDVWSKPYSSGLLNVNEGLEKMIADKCGNFVEYKEVPLDGVKIEVQSFKIPTR